MIEKALDIPDWMAILIRQVLPVSRASILDQIGQKNAMAQASEKIDVSWRCIPNIDDAETGAGLKPLAKRRPPARMTQDPGSNQALGGRGRFLLRFFSKPVA
jgi:hypothetical protein